MAITERTNTVIAVEGNRVVVQHDKPVGTQWMTPEQARTMAKALVQAADMAAANGN